MMPVRDHGSVGMELALVGDGAGAEGASTYPFPVVVEVRGITGPAQFSRLPDALAALLASLRALPLTWEQQEYFDELFGPSAVQTIGHRLAMYGEVRTLAFLGLTPHVVTVYPAGPGTPS
ncbi:hypothetical protein ABZW30_04430 [Kitasatospora sp. NPDC004669]|uniref:hypothetical protein n=1 Tax=Kitasatospora sp. NPDC004669 TaxID=3154555 RepID=UPI0033BE6288